MKTSTLQKSFKAENDEDDEHYRQLLLEAYKSNKQARVAIDSHMHLLESMQKAESIKTVEKHQRKSLGQVRNLINDICTTRKMRTTGFQASRVTSTAIVPNMDDVKAAT